MQGRRGENDATASGRWAVREHFVSGAYLRMYLSYCFQLFCVQYMNFDLLLVQNFDLFKHLDTHFVSGTDL